MTIRISDVRNLIDGWESKAIKALKEEEKQAVEERKTELLADPVFRGIYIEADKARETLYKCLHNLIELGLMEQYHMPGISTMDERMFSYESFSPQYSKIAVRSVIVDFRVKKEAIREEYRKLQRYVTICKTPKKAIKMLEDLGLDVSSLKENMPLVPLQPPSINISILSAPQKESVPDA